MGGAREELEFLVLGETGQMQEDALRMSPLCGSEKSLLWKGGAGQRAQ